MFSRHTGPRDVRDDEDEDYLNTDEDDEADEEVKPMGNTMLRKPVLKADDSEEGACALLGRTKQRTPPLIKQVKEPAPAAPPVRRLNMSM